MKDFETLQKICLAEVEAAGIPVTDNEITWEINRRAKTRWGQCRKDSGNRYSIQISAQLLEDDRVSEKACKETMIHEILHTCEDCLKHTGKWKAYAGIMNQRYGYNIKRTSSGVEKGVENHEVVAQPYKYIFICKKCGQQILRKRDSKFTRYYKNYSCGICGTSRAFRKYTM